MIWVYIIIAAAIIALVAYLFMGKKKRGEEVGPTAAVSEMPAEPTAPAEPEMPASEPATPTMDASQPQPEAPEVAEEKKEDQMM
ncbi:MAG: hypothetical protein COU85_01045 [Candidatus Portnoybacteria bacterium CG10_big_fil_rev_8_21_14_0_10_44_7]|uniref:Uncharacterized protein n=1 Tax=Candidatus Portnoybacteria bacterium CG10_big_fil_rev_8_21_14_0_10_44_7 TaxID=1974816 RepID=A0A2M8KJ49_9BACT|nr:MAG: hypothetical protein COU85_01045 [Candidatus Portnoybacteria bacterium CG10_big_fil_rev_8_21_14_0_10_44_7]